MSKYKNHEQLMKRLKELELELKKQQLSIKFNRKDKKLCNFLLDNLPHIVFKLNRFGKIVFINNAVKAYQYEPETLIGRDIMDFVHPDDVDKVKHRIKERRSGDRSTKNLEVRLFSGNRETIHKGPMTPVGKLEPIFSVAARGVYSSKKPHIKTFLGTLGIARDITKRKKAEDDLKKSKAFLDAIIDNIPAAVFVKDANELRYVLLNKKGEELLGHSRKEMMGKKISEIFLEAEAAIFTQNDKRVLEKKEMVDLYEVRVKTKQNQEHILQTRKIPLLDENGHPGYIIGIALDITEQKKLEELARQTQKLEALGTLTGELAHDFNNILTIILGHTEMSLAKVSTDCKLSSQLSKVMQAGERAKELVNQILTFSRQMEQEKASVVI